MITVGIPRALLYWKQPYFWETFFENLGLKVILSPETNKEIVENGVKVADPEACFATKVFFGHILWLDGKANWIFVPRLKRNELGLEYCPRFFGLPDLVPLLIKTPLISPWIDLKKENLEPAAFKVGKKFCNDLKKTKTAIQKSLAKVKEEKEKNSRNYFPKLNSNHKKILLISHQYNLYDDYVNLEIKKKLENLGAEVIFIDEIPSTKTEIQNKMIPKFHWEFGQEMMRQIREILKYKIAGAIEISSFQCGCDAVLREFVEKEFKMKKIPFLYLMIDEHTADAGIQTRLEAFIDTL